VRIFTGAIVPPGADAVVMQEDVERDGETVRLSGDAPQPMAGRHIRKQASDFGEGDVLIRAGTCLLPPRLALAATAGHGSLPVAPPLRVSVLSTGSELVPLGEPCSEEQIPASNGVMIAALAARPGVIVDDLGIVADDPAALADGLDRARGTDILVTIGGASVGDHDLVRPALIEAGASIDFWKVAIKPGKPLMAGMMGPTIVIGLPGNPVSAYVTAMLFLHPLIERMRGNPASGLERGTARLGEALPANGNRTDHIRARLEGGVAWPVGINDSAALSALAAADCLIVRPPGAGAAAAGEDVPVLTLG
jgi:molybdopterin molybdotransferase